MNLTAQLMINDYVTEAAVQFAFFPEEDQLLLAFGPFNCLTTVGLITAARR